MFLFLLSIDSCMDKNGNCPLWAKLKMDTASVTVGT